MSQFITFHLRRQAIKYIQQARNVSTLLTHQDLVTIGDLSGTIKFTIWSKTSLRIWIVQTTSSWLQIQHKLDFHLAQIMSSLVFNNSMLKTFLSEFLEYLRSVMEKSRRHIKQWKTRELDSVKISDSIIQQFFNLMTLIRLATSFNSVTQTLNSSQNTFRKIIRFQLVSNLHKKSLKHDNTQKKRHLKQSHMLNVSQQIGHKYKVKFHSLQSMQI